MSSVMRFDEWQDSNGVARNAIIAVKDVLKTDTFSASVAASGNVAVTDLSITHEVENASNKLIMMAFFGAAASDDGRANTGIAIYDGTSLLAIGDAAGSNTRVTAGGPVSVSGSSHVVASPSIQFVHTPGAGSKTYTIRAINIDSVTQTIYVNRTQSTNTGEFYPKTASSFIIMEVAA